MANPKMKPAGEMKRCQAPSRGAWRAGPVVAALDGDTLEVLHHHHPERIRLSGIDCSEKGQAFGKQAKHAASAVAFGKEVTLQTHGHDKYTRSLSRRQEVCKWGSGGGPLRLMIHVALYAS